MTSRLIRLASFLLAAMLILSACGPVTAVPTSDLSATSTPSATEPVIPATSTATRVPSIDVSVESLWTCRA